ARPVSASAEGCCANDCPAKTVQALVEPVADALGSERPAAVGTRDARGNERPAAVGTRDARGNARPAAVGTRDARGNARPAAAGICDACEQERSRALTHGPLP